MALTEMRLHELMAAVEFLSSMSPLLKGQLSIIVSHGAPRGTICSIGLPAAKVHGRICTSRRTSLFRSSSMVAASNSATV